MLRHRISFSTALEVSTLATRASRRLEALVERDEALEERHGGRRGSRPRLDAVTKIVCRTPGASFSA